MVPGRILDTREANGQAGTSPLGAAVGLTLQVAGRGGVPAANATAVSLNVTVDGPLAAGLSPCTRAEISHSPPT